MTVVGTLDLHSWSRIGDTRGMGPKELLSLDGKIRHGDTVPWRFWFRRDVYRSFFFLGIPKGDFESENQKGPTFFG